MCNRRESATEVIFSAEGVANTGHITRINDHLTPSQSIDYTYDELDRLKKAGTLARSRREEEG